MLGAGQEVLVLRAVQRWLWPLSMAAQCMTTREAVEEYREAINQLLTGVDRYAGELENELAEDKNG
jgi:hypothetical protein